MIIKLNYKLVIAWIAFQRKYFSFFLLYFNQNYLMLLNVTVLTKFEKNDYKMILIFCILFIIDEN